MPPPPSYTSTLLDHGYGTLHFLSSSRPLPANKLLLLCHHRLREHRPVRPLRLPRLAHLLAPVCPLDEELLAALVGLPVGSRGRPALVGRERGVHLLAQPQEPGPVGGDLRQWVGLAPDAHDAPRRAGVQVRDLGRLPLLWYGTNRPRVAGRSGEQSRARGACPSGGASRPPRGST